MNPEAAGEMTAARGRRRRAYGPAVSLLLLAALGLAMLALWRALIVRYASFPAGHDLFVGANPHAVTLFRALWRYPASPATPEAFMAGAQQVVLALWIVYLVALAAVYTLQRGPRWRQAVALVAAFALLFNGLLVVAMPPVLSKDIFHYALYGRMVAYHGQNPYVVAGSAVSSDPFWPLTAWREVTSRYGPTWTLASAGATALAGDSVLATVWVFKGLAALANLASAALVFLLARRITGSAGLVALLLYAWNPLILVETAGNAHADALMAALALLGVLLAVRGRPLAGYAVLLLSAQVKFASAVLLPFLVVHALAQLPTSSARRRFLAAAAAITAALLAVLYLPFAHEGAAPGRVLFAGEPALNVAPNPLWLALQRGLAGQAAARGWEQVQAAPERYLVGGLTLAFLALLALLVGVAARRRQGWDWIMATSGWLIFLYLVVVHGGSFPWYLVTPLAFVIVALPPRITHLSWLLFAAMLVTAIFATLFYTVPIPVP